MPSSIIGSIAGPVIGGLFGNKAAKQGAQGANDASALQKYIFDMINGQNSPYRQAGYGGLTNLSYLLGIGPKEGLSGTDENGKPTNYAPNTDLGGYGSLLHAFGNEDFQKDPGYDFRMQEGQKALERGASSKGTLLSGAGLKAITDYGQNFASNEFQNAYNRYNQNQNNVYSRLSGVAGMGQNAINSTASAGQNYANAAGQNMQSAAGYNAANTMNQGQSWATGLANLGGGANPGTYQNGQSFEGNPINWNMR